MENSTDTTTATLIRRARRTARVASRLADRYAAGDMAVSAGDVVRAREAYCAALDDYLTATGGWEPAPVAGQEVAA